MGRIWNFSWMAASPNMDALTKAVTNKKTKVEHESYEHSLHFTKYIQNPLQNASDPTPSLTAFLSFPTLLVLCKWRYFLYWSDGIIYTVPIHGTPNLVYLGQIRAKEPWYV